MQTARQISSASRPAVKASLTVSDPSSLIAMSCEKEVAQSSPNESTSLSRRSEIRISCNPSIKRVCALPRARLVRAIALALLAALLGPITNA